MEHSSLEPRHGGMTAKEIVPKDDSAKEPRESFVIATKIGWQGFDRERNQAKSNHRKNRDGRRGSSGERGKRTPGRARWESDRPIGERAGCQCRQIGWGERLTGGQARWTRTGTGPGR
jgi:hypothetical protein